MSLERPYILLSYKRVPGRDLSSGAVTFAGEEACTATAFEASDWRSMMILFVRVLVANPTVEHVYIQRTDRENLVVTKLAKAAVDRWRRDPLRAIAELDTPPVVVDVRREKVVRMVPPLRAGEATVAATFGELVYTRARAGDLECVGCGAWCKQAMEHYTCRNCGTFRFLNPHKLEHWVGVPVSELLQPTSKPTRFYLPRAWNPHGKWIDRAQLQEMFTQFRIDKEKASS